MRIPVNTQHPEWGYENAVACLNTNLLNTALNDCCPIAFNQSVDWN